MPLHPGNAGTINHFRVLGSVLCCQAAILHGWSCSCLFLVRVSVVGGRSGRPGSPRPQHTARFHCRFDQPPKVNRRSDGQLASSHPETKSPDLQMRAVAPPHRPGHRDGTDGIGLQIAVAIGGPRKIDCAPRLIGHCGEPLGHAWREAVGRQSPQGAHWANPALQSTFPPNTGVATRSTT